MSTPEAQVNEALAAKREALAADAPPVPDVPSHTEAIGQGREVYPEGQRG
jgi:hypothetical protein